MSPPRSRISSRRSRPPERGAAGAQLTGPERAAVLMLSLGDQYGAKIWALLDDDDLRALSIVMSTLGTVELAIWSRTCCSNSSASCRHPAR